MRYREMPNTGDSLSILGFGCMRFPEKGGRIDEVPAEQLILRAVAAGINYFDTAFPYHNGQSETFLGQVLARNDLRDKVKLATKLPQWQVKQATDFETCLQTQLAKLQTDHIDYYLVHNLTGSSWDRLVSIGIKQWLTQAKQSGHLGHLGFSFHGTLPDFKRIIQDFDWEFCQIQYNFLDEENQAGTVGLEFAAAHGLGVIVMEPLRGGNLARNIPPAVNGLWEQAERKRSPAEWALRWVWNRPEVSLILSGMSTAEQLAENVTIAATAAPNALSANELNLVQQVAQTYRRLMKAGCTGCRYCMPCPHGVDIPYCFELYNNASMFDQGSRARFNYLFALGGILNGTTGYASQCKQCGQCLKACPQHLEIPTLLKAVQRELERCWTKPMARLAQIFLARQMNKMNRQVQTGNHSKIQ